MGYTSIANDGGTYLGALSISVPLPYFIHGWTVKKTQSSAATMVKVRACGAAMGKMKALEDVLLMFLPTSDILRTP